MCQYCEPRSGNDFVEMNQTKEYSGIEMAVNCQGMLRVRYYEDCNRVWFSEDIVNIKHCPLCGRAFNG